MIESQLLSTAGKEIDPRSELINTAKRFYLQGWMAGTAGNLSARLADGSFWITASGRSKGELNQHDFVRVAPDGKVLEPEFTDLKPSAETAIHQTIYALFPEAKACYHIHSIEANIVSRLTTEDSLPLPPLEMLKGLGVRQENLQVKMPVFANHPEVAKIATEISDRFRITPPTLPALLLRDHGVTVWATSLETARNRIELVEYIFRYMVVARQSGVVRSD